ncbi:hypothetical protein [Streptomyces sp. NPDC002851]
MTAVSTATAESTKGTPEPPPPTHITRTAPAPATTAPTRQRSRTPRHATQLVLPFLLALLALPLVTAAHHAWPAPYGDRLTVHARVGHDAPSAEPRLRTKGRTVEAYDPITGRTRWTYAREGRRPLGLLPAPGHAIALWDDGIVTDTVRRDGRAVRWHRAVPGAADWLRTPSAHGGAGVLRALDPGARMVAAVTPDRIVAYRGADGDLRWVLPARPGCAFDPARAVRRGSALLVAQPCAAGQAAGKGAAWPFQLIAVDDLGRITPDRQPLGNALPGPLPEGHPGKAPRQT